MAIPLFWYLLDKKGNSNYHERMKIIEDFISVFGLEKIKVLVADRVPQGHFLRAVYRKRMVQVLKREPDTFSSTCYERPSN